MFQQRLCGLRRNVTGTGELGSRTSGLGAHREQHLQLGHSHAQGSKLFIYPSAKSQQDALHLLKRLLRLFLSLWQRLFFHILRIDAISAN
jgi:hypothetical protein